MPLHLGTGNDAGLRGFVTGPATASARPGVPERNGDLDEGS